jgi:DNA-binding NtrC family response regulator
MCSKRKTSPDFKPRPGGPGKNKEGAKMETTEILLVDDEPNILNALKRTFSDDPYRIYTADSAAAGMELLGSRKIKLVISDEMMPGMSGSDFLAQVRTRYPYVVRMMLTGHASIEAAIKAINEGQIYRFFTKPWNDLELRFSVRAAIEKYNLEEENRGLLRLVRRQAMNMKALEREYPGITRVNYDKTGRIVADEVTETDIEKLLSELDQGPTGY